jgi:hypothetical protein
MMAATIVTDHEWEPSVEGTTACEFCGRRPGDHQYINKFNASNDNR